ncbi:MAG: hypothetical protein ACOYL6_18690 [Bacteriovoracaceae bacterium]
MKILTLLLPILIIGSVHGAEIDLNNEYAVMQIPAIFKNEFGVIKEESFNMIRSKETPIKVNLTTKLQIIKRICENQSTVVVGQKCKKDKYGNDICKDIYSTVCTQFGDYVEPFQHDLKLNFRKLGPISDDSTQNYKVVVKASKSGPGSYTFNYIIKTPDGVKVTETFGSFFSFKKD